MRRPQKVFLIVVTLVVASQIPFAYRRYELGRLHAAIQHLNSQPRTQPREDRFTEYKGVVHVHSYLGGHSKGTLDEIVAAAHSNQLNFVVMTEHVLGNSNTAAQTLKGKHGETLFINGNEISTTSGDRLLVIPGDESANSQSAFSTSEAISKEKARGAHLFVAYPQEFKSWNASGYEGVEVYNIYTNARQINPLTMFFDGLWAYRSYPDLLFARFYVRPSADLEKWDQAIGLTGRKLVAMAGNDAHANVGVGLIKGSGETVAGLQLDPYERSFRLVRVHVLVPKEVAFDSASLLEAIARGHCFIGFDLFGDTSGFRFSGSNGLESRIQGDELLLEKGVRLTVEAPVSSRVLLYKDGWAIQDETGITTREYSVSEKGSYRVEVYASQLPAPAGNQPWIISNPIYVR